MEKDQKKQLFNQAKNWVLEAGQLIKKTIGQPLKVDTKSDAKDLVTEVDQDVERFFAEKIKTTYPDHLLIGEEGFGDEVSSLDGIVWIVDPIDGTMNFVHQKRNFAISVGIFIDGIGEIGIIMDVMDDTVYSAIKGEGAYKNDVELPPLKAKPLEESIIGINAFWSTKNRRVDEFGIQSLVKKARGTRSYGSAALEFAFVAEGIVDAYITMRLAPWDIAAGIVIVNEVGGITTRADGSKIDMLDQNSVITCNPSLFDELVNEYINVK